MYFKSYSSKYEAFEQLNINSYTLNIIFRKSKFGI